MKKFLHRLLPLLLALSMTVLLSGCNIVDYKKASKLMDSGDYAAASEMFRTLSDYKDSAELADQCDYQIASDSYESGDYAAALELFTALGDFEDSADRANRCSYEIAAEAYESGDYEKAYELFTALGDYEDSAERASASNDKAIAAKLVGEWVSDNVDITDMIGSVISASLGTDEESQKAFSYCDFGTLTVKITLSVSDDGTCTMAVDKDSAAGLLNAMKSAMTDGLTEYLEASFTEIAEQAGMTLSELYAAYGAANFDELFELVQGMKFSEFIDYIFSEVDIDSLEDDAQEGTCTVENGKTLFVFDGEECASSFDVGTETLVISDPLLGDITFTRPA